MATNWYDQLDKNIENSATLNAGFYSSTQVWEALKEKVFATSWGWLGDVNQFFGGGQNIQPLTYYDKYLDEPLLLTKQADGSLRCMTNVCTHRGYLLVHYPTKEKKIVCGYHGRRFNLKGEMEFMPEFETAQNFPRPCDHLHQLPLKQWKQFLFTSLKPTVDFDSIAQHMDEKVGFLPIQNFRFAPEFSQDYLVHAHWALYCDNYLEGFHIPFVHQQLNKILDYGKYETVCYEHMNLQIGYGSGGDYHFNLPKSHTDYGEHITAFYFWIFPNMMFNFYPWGLSVNVVRPLQPNLTRVSFYCYLYDENIFKATKAAALTDKVEREDEFVVEAVQKGLQSRFYHNGRFSPTKEKGVHQFHCLLHHFLNK